MDEADARRYEEGLIRSFWEEDRRGQEKPGVVEIRDARIEGSFPDATLRVERYDRSSKESMMLNFKIYLDGLTVEEFLGAPGDDPLSGYHSGQFLYWDAVD